MAEDNKRRVIYCFIAILIALLAFLVAQNAQDTADINNIYVPIVNNTDLYPSQRVQGVTYWANDSPIDIYLIFHGLGTGASQAFDSNLSINGTVLQDDDFRTSAGVGFHDHWPLSARIPKGANYSVTNSSNVFRIEWREYPILSGKNGTLSVNQTFITNGSSFNATYAANISALQANDTYFNGTGFPVSTDFRNNTMYNHFELNKVNKTGDTMTGQLFIDKMNVDGQTFSNGALFVRNNRSYFYANNESYTFAFGYNQTEFNAGHLVYLGASKNVATSGSITSPDMQFSNAGGNPIMVINGTTGNLTAYGNASFPAGLGVILKSPDGTKCGILTWSNANTFTTTAITCP